MKIAVVVMTKIRAVSVIHTVKAETILQMMYVVKPQQQAMTDN